MSVWEVDFYRRPLNNQQGHPLWELLVCDATRSLEFSEFCPQPEANSTWLVSQFQRVAKGRQLPEQVQVFRPQCLSLVEAACGTLNIPVEPTRRTVALQRWLKERAEQYLRMEGYTGQPYKPFQVDSSPPLPLTENLWGEQWRFAALPALDLEEGLIERPIPILEAPKFLFPSQLRLAGTTGVPGVIIYGGRQSMKLASWLQQQHPISLQAIAGAPAGLILEAGLSDRWVVATFEDPEVTAAGAAFERRKQVSQGLHFLLVQPDDSGITYSGFWLLRAEDSGYLF